ncbi:AMP-dependent synthetase/ligase [Nesterenkonia halophila]|uniref:AMP-dependent synthetase/ligase n=1 Tax=Nesterenkonia halophila TaxID=302044 RepID=UPI001292B2EF|nr:AMP-dependent synthetase/ligase [Nesterenkonia halophila]
MTADAPITEAATEQVAHPDPATNVTDGVLALCERDPRCPVYAVPNGVGGWVDVTIDSFVGQVRHTARGLIGLGVGVGDRVVVMAPTSYWWAVIDQAIWFAGGVSVPIYETSSPQQVADVVRHAAPRLALVGGAEIAETVRRGVEAAAGGQGTGEHGAGAPDPDDRDRPAAEAVRVLAVDGDEALRAIAAHGDGVDEATLEAARSAACLDDVATLVYTSGTTGRPKGVRITHRNLAEGAANIVPFARDILGAGPSRTLIFLPLAHVLARAVQLICLHHGIQVAHSPGAARLTDDLASFRPEWMLAVPRVYEKVHHSLQDAARDAGRAQIAESARRTAVEYSQARQRQADGGDGPSTALRAKRALYDRLVYRRLRDRLGGQIRYMVCGASALNPEIAHFFTGAGLPVQEGYGLTESTAPITLNIPGATRLGTVGLPVPGSTVRVADDGEVLLRGSVVFDGYHRDERATEEAFDDAGFFRTGDLGALDEDGYLAITGRKKELLVTAGGKNIHPAPLEERIRLCPLVAHAVVVGDDRPFVAALITLDAEAVASWSAAAGHEEMSLSEAAEHSAVRVQVQQAVDAANEAVSRAESVRTFRILPLEFSEETGHVTPSQKLQRHRVIADCAEEIEAIYSR